MSRPFPKQKQLHKYLKPTDQNIIDALRRTNGIMAHAAALLGIGRSTIHLRVQHSPEMQQVLEEIREESIDKAEGKLFTAIDQGSEKSVHFYLRTIGKNRGYGDKVVVSSDPNAPLVVNHTLDLSILSIDDLQQLENLLTKAEPQSD